MIRPSVPVSHTQSHYTADRSVNAILCSCVNYCFSFISKLITKAAVALFLSTFVAKLVVVVISAVVML